MHNRSLRRRAVAGWLGVCLSVTFVYVSIIQLKIQLKLNVECK